MTQPSVVLITASGAEVPAEIDPIRAVADVVVADTAETLRNAQADCDVAFVWDFQTTLLREIGPITLDWIHTNSIGVDALLTPEVLQSAVALTNTRGVYERPMAEYVLASILFFSKDIRRISDKQRAHEWDHRPTEPIIGRRALVLGPGMVGREITGVLRGVGMQVDVVGRRARADEPGIGEVHALDELAKLLPKTDELIVALPLTSQTRGIVNAEMLAQLPTGARIINVSRGPLIDEPALLSALRTGHLGAATLDVFDVEPLPVGHPFWDMHNVLVTGHLSGDVEGWRERVVNLFLENFSRWQNGDDLLNVVDKQGFAVAGSSA